MNLKNRIIAVVMMMALAVGIMSQNLLAEEKPTTVLSLYYEVIQEVDEGKNESLISLSVFETEGITIEKVILPDGTETTENFASILYSASKNGIYEFKVYYDLNEEKKEELISVEVLELREVIGEESTTNTSVPVDSETPKNEQSVLDGDINELNADFEVKSATEFGGSTAFGVTEVFRKTGEIIQYDGWQLMQLELKIPYQTGLEITSIQPSVDSLYQQYSMIEKDDEKAEWIYSFYFKQNGIYEFKVNYLLNGVNKSVTVSKNVEGLVYIEDILMRRLLVWTWGDLSGLDHSEQYVTEEWLGQVEGNTPSGESYFTFGLNNDNAERYMKSLDGLQYLSSIYGMHIFDCQNLTETIEPITKGYYPALKNFRVSELNARPAMPKEAYNGLLVAQCIEKMPALTELVINGTGFSDMTVFAKIAQQRLDMGLEPQLNYIQAMLNNISSLDGIESQPNLTSINIGQNQIQSIEPLRNIKNINFLNLTRNQVFDLTPVNDNLNENARPGTSVYGFGGKEQKIDYDKMVKANLVDDRYRIELPMPIDIDGRLTDTASVKVHYQSGLKTYNAMRENGKTYISIPINDVDANLENPFENILFEFDFNNNSGTDSRTRGQFTGTVEFKASPLDMGELQINKTVQGINGDLHQEFTFNVILKNPSGQGTMATEYSYSGVSHEQGVPAPENGKLSFDATGKSTDVKLKHGQGIIIKNLLGGTEYEVMEVEANSNGYTTTATNQIGIITGGEIKIVEFINEHEGDTPQPKVGDLSVRLTVTGNGAEIAKEFPFTVKLDDSSITGTYGGMEFKSGIATFGLKHDQTIYAKGLPSGIRYSVTESNYDGYVVNKVNDIGIITDDKEAKVTFENRKIDTPIITPTPQSTATPPTVMTTPNSDSNVPNTADNSNIPLWLSLGGLSLVGFILAVFAKLQKKG